MILLSHKMARATALPGLLIQLAAGLVSHLENWIPQSCQLAVSALQSLQVIGIAQPPATVTDSDFDDESKAQADPVVFTVNDGNSEIQVSLSQQDNTYQISRSDVAGKYEISSAIYIQLIQLAQRASWFPPEGSDTAADTD